MSKTYKIVEILEHAKGVIKMWHGDTAWELYQNSPEMAKINIAINQFKFTPEISEEEIERPKANEYFKSWGELRKASKRCPELFNYARALDFYINALSKGAKGVSDVCEHQWQEVWKDHNHQSSWGTNRCMKCGEEDNWQHDSLIELNK